MSEADNKKLALSFFENLSAGNLDAAPELITDDLVWWLAVGQSSSPLRSMTRSVVSPSPMVTMRTACGKSAWTR